MRRIVMLFALLMAALAVPQAFAQECASVQSDNGGIQPAAFAGRKNVVLTHGGDIPGAPKTLPIPQSFINSAFANASGYWQQECPAADYPNIPSYSYKAAPGPGDVIMPVRYFDGPAPPKPNCPTCRADSALTVWVMGQPELWLFAQCPPQMLGQAVCDANGSPNWNHAYWTAVVAHELGHASGLGHDAGHCRYGLMDSGSYLGKDMRNGDYCRAANAQNCDPNKPQTCAGPFSIKGTVTGLSKTYKEIVLIKLASIVNGQEVSAIISANAFSNAFFTPPKFMAGTVVTGTVLSISNTNKICTIPTITMPKGHYENLTITCACQSSPVSMSDGVAAASEDDCPDEDDDEENKDPRDRVDTPPPICEFCDLEPTPDPWWKNRPGPKKENCTTECKFTGRECVDIFDTVTGDLIETHCYDNYECKPVCTNVEGSIALYGPTVALTNPRIGATVSGRTLISGYSNDQQGLKNAYFFLDGNAIDLEDRQNGVDAPEACADWNTPVPCNPNVGFRGYYNFAGVSPGAHKLEVLVTDADPEFPVPTVYEMMIQVGATCTDTIPPAITVAAPAGAATVNGIVAVTAAASDSAGVAKVELYVDGVFRKTDDAAPFTFLWDSRTVPNGSHTISLKAYDGCGNDSMSSGVTVTVNNVTNRKPIANNDTLTTRVGTAVTIRVMDNDEDLDGDALSMRGLETLPKHGTAAVLADGAILYTPEAGYAGNDAFQYEIKDSTNRRDRAWVTVKMSDTNQDPVAHADAVSTMGTAAVTIDVTANDIDPDGDQVRLIQAPIVLQPKRGYASRLSLSSIVYTPFAPYTGTDFFTYEITDGKGGRSSATVTISLSETNRAPVAVADSIATAVNEPVSIDVVANDYDPDGDQILLVSDAIVRAPSNGTAVQVSGTTITYTPNTGFAGTDSFEYEISDGLGPRARATVTIHVTSANTAPLAFDDPIATTPGTAVTVNVTANDFDPDGDVVTLTDLPITAAPAHGTAIKISATSITYMPYAGYSGTDRFQYEVHDGRGGTARAWVDVTISSTGGGNENPVAADDEVKTRVNVAVDIVVTANDFDPDGHTVALADNPIKAAPKRGTAARKSSTTITYTPNAGVTGKDTFQYEIHDGHGKSARAWVSVTIVDPNSRPVAADDIATVLQGGKVDVVVTLNDRDPDGDVVILSATEPIPTPAAHGIATKKNDTTITYRPSAGFTGTDRVQYDVRDGRGGHDKAWINITVLPPQAAFAGFVANTPPVAISDSVATAAAVAVQIDALANDYDADEQHLILTERAVTVPPLVGAVRRTGDRTLTYFAAEGYAGTDSFEYEITDGNGGTARAWVAIIVGDVNQAPHAIDDWVTTAVNRQILINPLVNDSDPEQDAIRLTDRAVASAPRFGSVRRVSNTQLAYTPDLGFTGWDFFYYEITDDKGHTVAARITVDVIDNSLPPVAVNDTLTAESGVPARVDVALNDSDPDGDALYVVSSTQPAHGTATWDSGTASVTYVSDPGYAGTDSFTYTISDPYRLESTATVSVTVNAARRAPVLQNDAATTKTRTPVLIGVLANDYDPDRNRLTIVRVTQPSGGSVVINRGESVTFTPGPTFAGTATFQYTVSDGTGMEATATVTVTVPNAPPSPRSEILAAREDQVTPFYAQINLLNNDTDPDGDELKVTLYEQPQNGTFQIAADLSMVGYTPKPNWSGMDTFHYTVSDPFGASVRVMSQINVSAVNDAPVAVNDSFSVYKNQLLTITQAQIVGNDTDLEGHTITLYAIGAPANGTVVKLAGGTVEYRPYGEFVGTDSFEYTIEDSAGGAYGFGRVNITVMPDAKPVASFTHSCTNLACSFDASASSDDRGIVLYQWVLGNNQSASGKTFNYTYAAAGSYTVRLTVTDAIGQTGVLSKVVTVTQPNAPPVAGNDSFSGPEDGTIGFNGSQLLANDSDSDGNTPLRITAVTQLPANGTLTYPADFSSFSFRPNANWFGTTSFKYTVADALGATAQGTVVLTVNSVNDAPVAGTDSFSVYKNQLLSITPQQLLANDSDPEGNPIYVFAAGPAVNGTVQRLANETIEYRPNNEFTGADFFDYTLRDSYGASVSGRVNITVLPDNPPVANFNVTCTGRVCSFDASSATDDRGIVSYQWTLGNGMTANGKTFTYTYPAAGTYQVRLTVYDVMGQTSIAAKWITPTEPPPDAVNDLFSFSKGYARSIAYVDMLRNDTDPNGDVLSVVSTSAVSIGTLTCDSNSCLFQPPSQYWYGQATFTYTISDGHGKTDTATVTIDFRY